MPATEYEIELDDAGLEWLRVRFETSIGHVSAFAVQYETTIGGRRIPVTRYDSAHGRPHRDILDRRETVVEKRWLDGRTFGEPLIEGTSDLRANWPHYRAKFFGE